MKRYWYIALGTNCFMAALQIPFLHNPINCWAMGFCVGMTVAILLRGEY